MPNWYKLDNAAKIFPSTTNTKNTSVFRISVVLKDPVNQHILQKVIDNVFDRFPMLTVKLRKGFFWNYLDENNKKILLQKETKFPCYDINPKENNGYLFKILYYQNRISLEVFHSLTDGSGAIECMKSLLYYYFIYLKKEINDDGKILLINNQKNVYNSDDSFSSYSKDKNSKIINNKKAYLIKGTPFDNFGNNVLHGIVSASNLNKIAKEKGGTITAYLIALLMYSIYQTRMKYGEYSTPIVVAVPVNLRKTFPSQTLRNFFGVINIDLVITKDFSFDDLVVKVNDILKKKTNKNDLQNLISNNVKFESNKTTRFVPLFIKNIFVNFAFNALGENKKTISLSNMGNILLPENMYKYINQFEAVLYPSKKSPINCGICTVNDRLTITFTRTIIETDILQYFFSFLSEKAGLNVEVYSNDWGTK